MNSNFHLNRDLLYKIFNNIVKKTDQINKKIKRENRNNSELYNKYKKRYYECNFPNNRENEYKLFKRFIKLLNFILIIVFSMELVN